MYIRKIKNIQDRYSNKNITFHPTVIHCGTVRMVSCDIT